MFSMFSPSLGIDLGTANTLVFLKGKGIVLREPSVVAMRSNRVDVLAVGEEAKRMIGRTPGSILAIRPMRDGVIADFEITEIMLKYFIRKATMGRSFFRVNPKVIVCVPCGITEVEKRAVEEATRAAGAREAYLMEESMAAAMGAGLEINEPKGSMVVDIGGGTTEIAIISLGGVVASRSLRTGGNHMDEAIIAYVKKKNNMIIGETTAEYIKIKIGSVYEDAKKEELNIRGRHLVSGLPASAYVDSEEVRGALMEPAGRIINAIRQVLEITPPELSADIIRQGIMLTGGTARLKGLNRLIAKETGMPVAVAGEPEDTVANGAGLALDEIGYKKDLRYRLKTEPV